MTLIVGQHVAPDTLTGWPPTANTAYVQLKSKLKSVVSEVARGLLKLGVQKNDVFNIYSQTA